MQADQVFVGVDVSKVTLVICRYGTSGVVQVGNNAAAIRGWLKTLPPEATVAMESTGRYHLLLARLVQRSARKVFVLNARDVHLYAKGLGARSKSDQVDARVIARYIAEHHRELHAWEPGTKAQEKVQALVRRRARLADHRAAIGQLMRGLKGLQPALRQLQKQFDELLKQIDRQVDAQVASEAPLEQGRKLLRTITGYGPQGSALLAALFSRLRFANADAVVAYSGLDLRANDSGDRHGRRRLSKRGNSTLRRQLYLAAFSATRSKTFGPIYQAIKLRGLAPTQAVVILARKLLRVGWAVWTSRKPFDPSRFAAPTACAKL